MATQDLSIFHTFAAELAITAGSYLRDQALQRRTEGSDSYNLQLSIKENAADLVTKADNHAEQLISTAIKERFPEHKIIGEETYSSGSERRFLLDDGPTWIIDPLDGTVNYVHAFPACCVSVGFCLNKKAVAGAIFAPLLGGIHPTNATGYLYSAAKRLGAWSTPISFPFDPACLTPAKTLPDQPFQNAVRLPYLHQPPFPFDAPKGCLFAGEWGKARKDTPESNLTKKVNTFWNFAAEIGSRNGKGGMVHGLRSLGSAALDMVYVSTGAVDIWWEGGCWEWDICAGIVLVEESGGRVVKAQPPAGFSASDAPIEDASLGDRLYLAVRTCSESSNETTSQAQERVIREVWKRAEPLDYVRPS